jgi:hypothetical protein
MKITRENYESFFIDYIEGNLPESMIDQFLDFLNQNPDLKVELHLFEEVNIPEDHVVFQEKQQLHKSSVDETHKLENIAIAYLEGDWDAEENKTVEAYLSSNPEFKREYDLIAKTQLRPDFGIKYPEKQKLYRKSGATVAMKWIARAAAVLVLIWGINSVIQTQDIQQSRKRNQEVAGIGSKPISTVKKVDSEKIDQETAVQLENKLAQASRPKRKISIQEKTQVEPKETMLVESNSANRDLTALAQITPIITQLEQEPTETKLAFSRSDHVMKINEPKNVMSVEGFLASRVQKVSKEGLFSAQRIARLGLNLASEISGKRIGYQEKDGKITSVDFESKLLAFSIPLEKK